MTQGKYTSNMMTKEELEMFVKSAGVHMVLKWKGQMGIVSVFENIGGSNYFSQGSDDLWTVKRFAHKVERRGNATLYYINTIWR